MANTLEDERLDVAEHHIQRALTLFKSKDRKGKDRRKLELLESAANAINIARLL